jgi:hypothetical protein
MRIPSTFRQLDRARRRGPVLRSDILLSQQLLPPCAFGLRWHRSCLALS